MSNGAHIALVQLEQALNNLQNSLVDEAGQIAPSQQWFDLFDNVLVAIIQSREMADNLNKEPLTSVTWSKVVDALPA